MIKLKENFKKGGMPYLLIERTDGLALFKLDNNDYEVSRIYIDMHPRASEPSEQITPNCEFGSDGSKSFYCYESAKQYYDQNSMAYKPRIHKEVERYMDTTKQEIVEPLLHTA